MRASFPEEGNVVRRDIEPPYKILILGLGSPGTTTEEKMPQLIRMWKKTTQKTEIAFCPKIIRFLST
jgi:hypothetical protein